MLNEMKTWWNNGWGCLKAAKTYNPLEWIQYAVICVGYVAGIFVIFTEIHDRIVGDGSFTEVLKEYVYAWITGSTVKEFHVYDKDNTKANEIRGEFNEVFGD